MLVPLDVVVGWIEVSVEEVEIDDDGGWDTVVEPDVETTTVVL